MTLWLSLRSHLGMRFCVFYFVFVFTQVSTISKFSCDRSVFVGYEPILEFCGVLSEPYVSWLAKNNQFHGAQALPLFLTENFYTIYFVECLYVPVRCFDSKN